MKKLLLITCIIIFTINTKAQLADGSVAPDWTLTDLNGTTHNLYSYLDDGYTVFIHFSAVWCPPCWSYHISGALEDLYMNHGPAGMPNVNANTTDDVMVFFIEGDENTVGNLGGVGGNTQGDWITGTPYPMICTDGTVNNDDVTSDYQIGYWPTIYKVCSDRIITEAGQSSNPYSLVNCLPPASQFNDVRAFDYNGETLTCEGDLNPEVMIQNYGLVPLTSVSVDVEVNGSLVSTTLWSGNLTTYAIDMISLTPLTGLNANDVVTMTVHTPNGVVDADPSNNPSMSFYVEMVTQNTDVEVTVQIITDAWGSETTWDIKDDNGAVVGSGGPFNNLTAAGTTIQAPVTINLSTLSCYTFTIYDSYGDGINAGYGAGSFTVIDGNGTTLAAGGQFTFEDNYSWRTVGIVTPGCTDSLASNYNPLANTDNGSCIYCDISFNPPFFQSSSSNTVCDGLIIVSATSSYSPITYSWSNGVSGANNFSLCTGIYSVTATDAGGCSISDTFTIGQIIYGCMDPLVSNYNPQANIDDGSCCIDGCTDATAFNYDPLATCNDSSCIPGLYGCTDVSASNYDALANIDNGSCYYCDVNITTTALQDPTTGLCNGAIVVNATSSYSSVSYSWNTGSTSNILTSLCLGIYELTATDLLGCIATQTYTLGTIIYGCMDSIACNYDLNANVDDSSCTYPVSSSDSIATCDSSYTWPVNGQTYTVSGTYTNYINNNSPTLTGTYNTPGNAYDVTVNGNYAYVANEDVGLQIIDISNPSNPTLTGNYDTPGFAWGVTVNGNYTYVADFNEGLQIIDISNPSNPTLTGTYNTPGFSWGVTVNGNYAYVADDNEGLQIIDISNPSNPTLNGFYNTPGNAYDVTVNGNYAYVADFNEGLQIIDISNPSNPTLNGFYNTSGNAYDVTVNGNYAYVVDVNEGLQIIDILLGCTLDSLILSIDVCGCTDSLAFNYDANANTDDGSCIAVAYGCIDTIANNYNPLANTDDGSCVFIYNVTFQLDLRGQTSLTYTTPEVNGEFNGWCGSCFPMSDANGDNIWEVTIPILEGSGSAPAPGIQYKFSADNWNIQENLSPDSACTYTFFNQSVFTNRFITVTKDTILEPVCWESCNYCIINGCTDPSANNYDSNATTDDGSCITSVFGCTDSLAFNYDTNANTDDGSCTYSTVCTEPTPTGLFTSNIVHNRATINWDNMNDANCTVDQYRIKYREVGTNSWSQKNMGTPLGSCTWACNKTDKLILGLNPGTTYEYQIRAWYCGAGNSAWSSLNTFTTLDACPNVGNLSVSTPNTTKATFNWDASNGVYEFVRIKSRVDSISNPSNSDWFNVGGAGVSYPTFTKNKNNLTPAETYRAQARTWCDPNGGAYKSDTWTPLVYWTQPTIRIEGGESIVNLEVYPNPSKDVFNISFTSESIQDLRVRVLNIVGEELIVEDLQQFIGEYTKKVSLNENAKGIYFLEIETKDGIINKKLILQ